MLPPSALSTVGGGGPRCGCTAAAVSTRWVFSGRQSAVTVTAAIARSGDCRPRKRVCTGTRGTALVMVAAGCCEEEGGSHSVQCSRGGSSRYGYDSAALSYRRFLATLAAVAREAAASEYGA
ncbi:hypothetical protein NDU88_003799 [Pleurodeles waltl]|uniref:Uncharacterized protein n=1 Tax=Pleurodeles waltl TaxID=8319 RepID=A0AAV7M5C2_PLEWA|nr:hypothetical protein NDU88_003799 [Pleurodeles waltl]